MREVAPYLNASIVHGLIFAAMRVGLDPKIIYNRVDLDLEALQDPDMLVPFEKHMEASRIVFSHAPKMNSSLHIGISYSPKRFGLLGHVMQHGATLEQALVDFARFQALTDNIYTRHISRVPEGLRIVVEVHSTVRENPDYLAITSRHEAPLTVPIALARYLTGKHVKPI